MVPPTISVTRKHSQAKDYIRNQIPLVQISRKKRALCPHEECSRWPVIFSSLRKDRNAACSRFLTWLRSRIGSSSRCLGTMEKFEGLKGWAGRGRFLSSVGWFLLLCVDLFGVGKLLLIREFVNIYMYRRLIITSIIATHLIL